MKSRNVSILLAFVLMAAGVVFANEVPAPPAIGSTIEEFALPDVDGTERTLKSFAGQKGTVLLFIALQCPVSNDYNERMEKLAQDYKAKGINVIGINSNVAEDGAAAKAHAAQNKLSFTILKDPGNKIADRNSRGLPARREQQAHVSRAHRQLAQPRASGNIRPAQCNRRNAQRQTN